LDKLIWDGVVKKIYLFKNYLEEIIEKYICLKIIWKDYRKIYLFKNYLEEIIKKYIYLKII